MTAATRIVKVNISRSNPTVSQTAFSAALLLAQHTKWADSAREYSTLAGILADGFLTSDPTYLAASDYFSQSPKPSIVIVGRRAMSRTVTIVTATATTDYTVTIAGTPYLVTSGSGSPTKASIRDLLITAINAATSTHHLTASTSSTDGLLLTPDSTGANPAVTVTATIMSIANTATVATIAADLNRIQLANSAWYGIILADRDNTNASSVASWTESAAPAHYFVYASADANIVDVAAGTDTTTLAYAWKLAGYTKSSVLYHTLAATRYPDAAMLGVILPMNPGSYTVKFKTLAGIPVDSLSDTQISNAAGTFDGSTFTGGKNAMVYVSIGGVSMLMEGMVAAGEFIDVMIGIDWLAATMTADVFANLAGQRKVPFTDAGLQGIGSIVSRRLNIATGPAFPMLASDPAPTVFVPSAASYTSQQKASRIASGITFTGTLSGAIHFTSISGNVTP